MIRRLAASGLACALLSQSSGPATGTVQGVAFTADADGGRSVLPDTRISLDGPSHIETRSARMVSSYSAQLPVHTRSPRKHLE